MVLNGKIDIMEIDSNDLQMVYDQIFVGDFEQGEVEWMFKLKVVVFKE